MTTLSPNALTRPALAGMPLRLALVLVGIALLALTAHALPIWPAASAASAVTDSRSMLATELKVSPALPTRDCWVSGDLVGDGNPIEIGQALCGRH